MVKLDKILDFLCDFAPMEFSESYDNVGLLVGDKNKGINKVLVTLDADEKVVDDAQKNGCELIISHHPLIFTPIKRITEDNSTSKSIIKLIKNDISLISMHTNFDSVNSGLCDLFLDKIAKTQDKTSIEGDPENGLGRIAEICEEKSLFDILNTVKKEFKTDNLKYIGDLDKRIKKIAVCNGGGADFLYNAHELGADLYISGDFKYHHARFAYENGIALIDVPHYNAEIIFCEYLNELLNKEFSKELDILITDKNNDVWKSI